MNTVPAAPTSPTRLARTGTQTGIRRGPPTRRKTAPSSPTLKAPRPRAPTIHSSLMPQGKATRGHSTRQGKARTSGTRPHIVLCGQRDRARIGRTGMRGPTRHPSSLQGTATGPRKPLLRRPPKRGGSIPTRPKTPGRSPILHRERLGRTPGNASLSPRGIQRIPRSCRRSQRRSGRLCQTPTSRTLKDGSRSGKRQATRVIATKRRDSSGPESPTSARRGSPSRTSGSTPGEGCTN